MNMLSDHQALDGLRATLTSTHSEITTHYRPDVDGLRAIAVLSVIAFHAFPNFIRGGFVGVDVFFVISGYLISSIIINKIQLGTFSFGGFYARRVRRIFPALILVLAACLLFGWYVLMVDEYRNLGSQVAGGVGFVSNFLLWSEAGYFDSAASTKPLLHLWSLGIEEQFYFIWPLLLIAAHKSGKNLLTIIGVGVVASFAMNIAFVERYPVATYYLPFMRFWELLIGSLLAFMTVNRSSILEDLNTKTRDVMAVAGLALIGYGIVHITKNDAFPGWWATLPTIGATLLIAAGSSAWVNRAVLSSKPLVLVGLISYPLYLWHWPLLSFLWITVGPHPPHILRIVAVVFSIALAWLTYWYFESKIRFNRHPRTLPALAACMVVLFTLGLAISFQTVKSRLDDPDLDKLIQAQNDWIYPSPNFTRFQFDGKDFYRIGSGARKTLFIGDSNVEQYGPNISKLLAQHPTYNTAIFATTGSCPPIPGVFVREQPECQPRLSTALKLALSEQVDTVVIGGCWVCYFADALKPDYPYEYYFGSSNRQYFKKGNGPELALASFADFLKKISKRKKVFLVLNMPAGPEMDPMYNARGSRFGLKLHFSTPPGLTQVEFDKRYASALRALSDIALASGAKLIDPVSYLCRDHICPATSKDGLPIYKDSIHLRASFVEDHIHFLDETVMPETECIEHNCLMKVSE